MNNNQSMNLLTGKPMRICACLMIASLIFSCSSWAKINIDDFAGLWLFDDDKKPATARYSSGNNHDAEVAKQVKRIDGVFGGALKFDGTQSYAIVPHDPMFNFGEDGNFSMGCWMSPERDDAYVVTKRGAGPIVLWGLNCSMDNASGAFDFQGYNDGVNRMVIGKTVIRGKGWFHCVAVRKDKIVSVYVNGKVEAKLDVSISVDSEAPIQMGGWGGENHIGGLDELFICKAGVALTQEDIRNIFKNGLQAALAVSEVGRLATVWGVLKAQ